MASGLRAIEQGDLYFFYRSSGHQRGVQTLTDVEDFYLILAPAGSPRLRLLVVREKVLPMIPEGEGTPGNGVWARVDFLTNIGDDLSTRRLAAMRMPDGRTLPLAYPVGVASYQIAQLADHTELAYLLEAPANPGAVQDFFHILPTASYDIRIRNPQGSAAGYPGEDRQPDFSDDLEQRFDGVDWLDVQEGRLLDFEHAQMILTGARRSNLERDLGISFSRISADEAIDRLYTRLSLDASQFPRTALDSGQWPEQRKAA